LLEPRFKVRIYGCTLPVLLVTLLHKAITREGWQMGGDHLWEAIGAIGQAVSAFALFLVLIQVRHARNEIRRSASQARKDGSRSLWLASAQPDLASVLTKAHVAAGGAPSPARSI